MVQAAGRDSLKLLPLVVSIWAWIQWLKCGGLLCPSNDQLTRQVFTDSQCHTNLGTQPREDAYRITFFWLVEGFPYYGL